MNLYAYVDGSSRKNNEGGYGIVIFNEENQLVAAYSKQFHNVTNNQMELTALLKIFEMINTKYINDKVTIYSDSAYCTNMLEDWIYTWSKNGWVTTKGRTVKNLDIIQSIYKIYSNENFKNRITIEKVKGHEGNIGNELSDALAQANKSKFIRFIEKNKIQISSSALEN